MKSALQTLTRRGCAWSERDKLRSVYKHDKSTSLCATDMSVKPSHDRLQVSWLASCLFQHLVCFLFFCFVYVSCWTEGLYTSNRIFFFFFFTGCLKCVVWVECICKYMDEWMCMCVCVCAYVLYAYMCMCMFSTCTLTLETSCLHILFLWDETPIDWCLNMYSLFVLL